MSTRTTLSSLIPPGRYPHSSPRTVSLKGIASHLSVSTRWVILRVQENRQIHSQGVDTRTYTRRLGLVTPYIAEMGMAHHIAQ